MGKTKHKSEPPRILVKKQDTTNLKYKDRDTLKIKNIEKKIYNNLQFLF